MKTILIILDGLSEEEITELGHKTPLEYANTPTLNEIMINGSYEKRKFYPANKTPDSLNCILSILGVNEKLIPKNRAYLEALAAGIKIEDFEVALRCNLVSVKNGMLHSFNAMGLSPKEIITASHNVKTMEGIKFYHISGYRNIVTINKNKINCCLRDIPPHENVGENINLMLDNINSIYLLAEFVKDNKFTLNSVEYMFYPWGISEKIKLPTFKELHNKTCSCICSAEIVKGIAKAMDIDVPLLKNSTGDVDTDLKEKRDEVLRKLKSHDVVIAHINGTDEISHRKDLTGKIKFIEKVDSEFIKYIYEENKDRAKIIITSDHQTSSITGKHEKGFVDFIVSNTEGE